MSDVIGGLAAAFDVDLDISTDDLPPCMICVGSTQAVMQGVISTPCGHRQLLCLRHYEEERPKWSPGDLIWCRYCIRALSEGNGGRFIRWEKISR